MFVFSLVCCVRMDQFMPHLLFFDGLGTAGFGALCLSTPRILPVIGLPLTTPPLAVGLIGAGLLGWGALKTVAAFERPENQRLVCKVNMLPAAAEFVTFAMHGPMWVTASTAGALGMYTAMAFVGAPKDD